MVLTKPLTITLGFSSIHTCVIFISLGTGFMSTAVQAASRNKRVKTDFFMEKSLFGVNANFLISNDFFFEVFLFSLSRLQKELRPVFFGKQWPAGC